MKKLVLLLGLFPLQLMAAALPDNIYFKAMKDEMDRSFKQLHLEKNPKPFYIAYRLEKTVPLRGAEASLGELFADHLSSPEVTAVVTVSVGNNQQDSLGVQDGNQTWFMPQWNYGSVADSYKGIRQALWQKTDKAYLQATEMYEKKNAYKRLKQLDETLPDIVPAPVSSYVEEVAAPIGVDETMLKELVQRLSAEGKKIPYLEQFYVSLHPSHREIYFLNSRGSFFQYGQDRILLEVRSSFRTKRGYKRAVSTARWLDTKTADVPRQAEEEVTRILQRVQSVYEAKQGQAYVGPVLLMPNAAAYLWVRMFAMPAMGAKPLLWLDGADDKTSGQFKNKIGMRVASNAVSIYDRPHLKAYNGTFLSGFTPVDDEGIATEDLTLVTGGVLRDLPRSMRPAKKGDKSNGHGRLSPSYFPREQLTNLVIEAVNPLSQQELEDKLLERCRSLELEYCYILHSLPTDNQLERIYTQDGHKEPVDQLKFETDFTARSLRDIVAAGGTAQAFSSDANRWMGDSSVITPALLIEEMELVPVQAQPDKKPFVPMP